jgi:pyoverdine/dityrosine biosynthesis protein Dit1
MEVSNDGESFYHRFAASVLCDDMGQPLYSTGPRQQWIQDHWALLHQEANLKVYQNSKPNSAPSTISAVVINQASGPRRREAFEEFFAQLILDQADLCAQARVTSPDSEAEVNTQVIVDLFDRYLRYEGHNDQWMACGRAYFAERVRHFILRNIPVQLCLPAFPCKSSNIDKVTGTNPDRGEELALERLHGFIEAIERVYAPGAKLWIISDGHVFSDCIGVDDAAVDEYGAKLKEMNHVVGTRRGNVNRVGFKSLVDLFELGPVGQSAEHLKELANRLDIPNIEHHIDTKHTDEAELCRRILMAACGPSKTAVRARIESGDPAITALYRGFSRFMLEDLEHHPATQGMSKAQRKKLSARVAFEMILVRDRVHN